MIPVLIVAHNCFELTKRCVESVENQDIPTSIFVYDNGSTDETAEWLIQKHSAKLISFGIGENLGVSYAWNIGISTIFNFTNDPVDILVMNNDTIVPSWFLRRLLAFNLPFVTGISVGSTEEIVTEPSQTTPTDGPDFSGFLIRKDAWATIGPFDQERMVSYCGDLDYHLRAHRKGIRLLNGHIPFAHFRSSTLNNAPPREKRLIELRADADRKNFKDKWGIDACSPEYASMFSEETFGIDNR